MSSNRPNNSSARGIRVRRIRIAGLLLIVAAIPVVLGYQWPWSTSFTEITPSTAAAPIAEPTVADDQNPGVTNLDPDLLAALRRAATAAADDGIQFHIDSGWRSAEHQEQLLRDAVAKYGSVQEAARWVATPDKSAHVSGDAVDIGPSGAAAWLSEHGAAYGLCQIYDNEPWHFELRPGATGQGCPARYADPTHDPRMRQ